MVEIFCWTVSVVCGTMAGAVSNQPITFKLNWIEMIWFKFEWNLEALQVPNKVIIYLHRVHVHCQRDDIYV